MLDIITVAAACFITFIVGMMTGAYVEYKSEGIENEKL
jgi:hypothetical protein